MTAEKQTQILTGRTVRTESAKEAEALLQTVGKALGKAPETFAKELIANAVQFTENPVIRAVGISDTIGMLMIHIAMETDADEDGFDLLDEYGCLCYVYNVSAPQCSELGFCGFAEREDGAVFRIW